MSTNYQKYHTTITPKRGLFNIDFKEIWKYRDLIIMFVKKDFALTYKQTILGPLWIFITPLITTLIYTVVFGNIAKLSTDGIPKIMFYMFGNTLWSFFAACINKTANTFKDNAHIFGKVYFPRLTKPISCVISAAINLLIQLLIFLGPWIYYICKGSINPNYKYMGFLILVLLIITFMALGCGIIVSSLTTKYRDLSVAFSFCISLWMYATPVVYPLSTAGEGLTKKLLLINPVTQLMEISRFIILGEGTISVSGIIWSVSFSLIVLLIGIVIFNKIEKTFIDTV